MVSHARPRKSHNAVAGPVPHVLSDSSGLLHFFLCSGPPEPGGPGEGGPSPNTFHTKAALSEVNFFPWDVLVTYLLGVS